MSSPQLYGEDIIEEKGAQQNTTEVLLLLLRI